MLTDTMQRRSQTVSQVYQNVTPLIHWKFRRRTYSTLHGKKKSQHK